MIKTILFFAVFSLLSLIALADGPVLAQHQSAAKQQVRERAITIPLSVGDYVNEVGAKVAYHQEAVGGVPQTAVRESGAVASGLAGPKIIEITTGMLKELENEAQLAAVLAYEQARALGFEIPTGKKRSGLGRRIAVSATAGAAAAVVADAIHRNVGGDRWVRAAASGAATAATVTLVYAAFPRRHNRPEVRLDNHAAEEAVRVLARAGYDPAEAPRVWERLNASEGIGGREGGYGDAKANRKRMKIQRKTLRRLDTGVEGFVGTDEYRTAVISHL